MPKQMKDWFKDPENPTLQEMRDWMFSQPASQPSETSSAALSRAAPLSEHTAQRLILSLEALTLALQENTQAMVMEPQVDSTDSDMDDSPPPSLMHPGKIEH